MQMKTLLNRVLKNKGFVYEKVRLEGRKGRRPKRIRVEVRARKKSCGRCSRCRKRGICHDHLAEREFDFVPVWGIVVVLVYAMRRVKCARCGIRVEEVPWAQGKSRLTKAFACYLAEWARDLSWSKVGERFKTSWYHVREAVRQVVEYGKKNRKLMGIAALGVDEVAWSRGHRYLTLVYQIDAGCRRLLWVGQERSEETLRGFFGWLGEMRKGALKYVCSDMWKPYLKVIREAAPQALNILDRFHVMAKMNRALDEVRRQEAARLEREGKRPVLKHSRWCILKRASNLTKNQVARLRELTAMNLRTVKAYLMKEDFQQFWEYRSVKWAGRFLDEWCRRVNRSRIEPLSKMGQSLQAHRELLLNWFVARKEYSSGIVEAMNNKVKTRVKIGYGYKRVKVLELALYHELGRLPVPRLTHRFF